VQTCADGSCYVGEFKCAVKHGLGVYHFRWFLSSWIQIYLFEFYFRLLYLGVTVLKILLQLGFFFLFSGFTIVRIIFS
jgi:hypothetical protein